MTFGKNNDECIVMDYSPYNGYSVEIENVETNNMKVSLLEKVKIDCFAEQCSSHKLIHTNDFSLFMDDNKGKYVILLGKNRNIKEVIATVNSYRFADRKRDIEKLRNFLPEKVDTNYGDPRVCLVSLYRSVGLEFNESFHYTGNDKMHPREVSGKLLNAIKIPPKTEWVKDDHQNEIMVVIKIGFAKLAIYSEKPKYDVFHVSFGSWILKQAEKHNAIEVEYV